MTVNEHLQHIIGLHFDPQHGAPYWLERRSELRFDPRTEIASVAELSRLGDMDTSALARRPVEDFIPIVFHDRLHEFITSETGGTTGPPKRTAYLADEFAAAFVTPFLRAAEIMAFPRNVHWLFIGPSGPHIIGKAARACAVAMGSIDPFTVDFDPRWARHLPAGSLARQRYVNHVLEQALSILRTQHIGVLFATPPILEALVDPLSDSERAAITGIHIGGMAPSASFWGHIDSDWFPNAVVMAGYGNSLAGVCPQLEPVQDGTPTYFVHGRRLVVDVRTTEGAGEGQVVLHRLDESMFLPNVVERDFATPVPLPGRFRYSGFQPLGIRGPYSPATQAELAEGLY